MNAPRLLACLLLLTLSPMANALGNALPSLPAESSQVAASRIHDEPWMAELQRHLRLSPGFLGLLPDGTHLHALFAGDAPALSTVPAPWRLEAVPHAQARPMLLPLPPGARVEPTPASAPIHRSVVPALAWNDGIGPGAHIYMDFQGTGNPQFLCTSNYVWKDQDGTLYLGAAGHCFLPAGSTATVNAGPDGDVGPGQPGAKDSSKHNFWACWQDCWLGGVAGGLMQDVVLPNAVKLGPVAYARQKMDGKDIGNDFGLITIPRHLYADVDPSIPVWGGPRGTTTTRIGEQLLIHGNGNTDGETFATKSRTGASLGDNGDGSFSAALKSSGGDSGAPITTTTGFGAPRAVGLLTHGIQLPVVRSGLGYILGTTVAQAQKMALQASLCIAPLEAGQDPLAVQPAPEGDACRRANATPVGSPRLTITAPAHGSTV
ncbi:MAG TPA: hypothetical protein VHI93_04295, partial [Candidatus Thermoplasmatota archaeon]|nr:hypothetical protein [Candidatus Thermoplasmatota archaeon]